MNGAKWQLLADLAIEACVALSRSEPHGTDDIESLEQVTKLARTHAITGDRAAGPQTARATANAQPGGDWIADPRTVRETIEVAQEAWLRVHNSADTEDALHIPIGAWAVAVGIEKWMRQSNALMRREVQISPSSME